MSKHPQQRSSAVGVFAAIACVLLLVFLLIGGVVVAGLFFVQRAVNQELEDLGSAISALDQSYMDETGAVPAIVLAEAYVSDLEQAQISHGGNWLVIDGIIAETDADEMTITFEGAEDESGRAVVVIRMANGEFEHAMNELSLVVGDFTSIRGQVDGFRDGAVIVQDGRLAAGF